MPYLGKSPEFGVRERYYYTQSSGGGTSVSGSDDNGITLKFTDGNFVDVFLNGVLLVDGTDYGTSTANTISNLSALASGDVIEVLVYDVFNIAKNQAEVTRTRYYKTASGSETSISGNDDSGVAIEFPAGAQLDVSLNGVSLVAGSDYNTSTANTISGLSALTAGNVIEIVKYEKFVVSDTVSKAAGGTFGGAITATSFTGDGSGLTGVSAGKVLKMSISQITANSTRSASGADDFADDLDFGSFTPSTSSSTIFIWGVANMDSPFQKYMYYRWVVDGSNFLSTTGTTPTYTHVFYSNTTLNDMGYMPSTIMTSVANTDGSAIAVKCQGALNATGTIYINRSAAGGATGSPSTVIFMEVAN